MRIDIRPQPLSVKLVIEHKWRDLGGLPGPAVSGVETVTAGTGGARIRYAEGAIYGVPGGGGVWVHGAIGQRYHAMGGPSSWLGFPLTDEAPFPQDGVV